MKYYPQGHSLSDTTTQGDQTGSLDSLTTEEFLRVIGLRVRAQRSAMSMSRKRLAEVSGVSERYLAQLESGQGNMSIALLRKVTAAIDMSLATLLAAETPELGHVSHRPLSQTNDSELRHNSGRPEKSNYQTGVAHPVGHGKLVSDIK